MSKSIIAMSTMFFLIGCTINGKHLGEMMEKKAPEPQEESIDNAEDATVVPTNEKSSSGIHFKWANKEYHEGKEEINFGINSEED